MFVVRAAAAWERRSEVDAPDPVGFDGSWGLTEVSVMQRARTILLVRPGDRAVPARHPWRYPRTIPLFEKPEHPLMQ
jgi:hypothetical protein